MKRMNIIAGFALLAILFSFYQCGNSRSVIISKDEETDFSTYQTFSWLPDDVDTALTLPFNNEIIRNNIRNYFGQEFIRRGYFFNAESPDLLLGLQLDVKDKENTTLISTFPQQYYYCRNYFGSVYCSAYPLQYYYNYPFVYPPDYYTRQVDYFESSITLYVFDRKMHKLVWSGTAMEDIFDPEFVNKNINPAIRSIMKKYPVNPIGKR